MEVSPVVITADVFHRTTRKPRWAVAATYVTGQRGDPVCIEYRVRVLRGDGNSELLRNLHLTLNAMEDHATDELAGDGPFPDTGIPRYVFERASQGRLLERARRSLDRNPKRREKLTAESRALLAAPAHKPGRPPRRSMLDKLRILEAVEAAQDAGETLEDVAGRFDMSRSAVRDLLSWARRDAAPRLFTASGLGRRGGRMTPDARAMLRDLRGE